MESSKSESLSLSLIEVEEQHSVPLRFYDPKVSSECKLLTRSPRSAQGFDVPNIHDCLRRSPRFANAGSILSGPDGQTPKRSHRFDLPKTVQNGLRRSPRLVSDDTTDSDAFTPKRPRRSPHAPTIKMETLTSSNKIQKKKVHVSYLIGDPIHAEEAQEKWRWRYDLKEKGHQEVIKKVKLNVLIMQETKMAAIVRMVTGVILGVDLMNEFSF
ncbi:hypothetical protein Q3G72_027641 [Acer saccharum]|nr:hypothetical protein Q3G72_027641 [Acer saccharum]